MECPTALKILKELNKAERNGIIFNSFGNPHKKVEVKKALKELKQAINSHEKYKAALDWIKGATDIDEDRCKCGRPTGVLAIYNHASKALEAEKKE